MDGDWAGEADKQTGVAERGGGSTISLCTNGVTILSSDWALSCAQPKKTRKRVGEMFERWCTEPGAVRQLLAEICRPCFCVCALGFHTLTRARSHMHWPIVSVFIWTLSDSLEYLTATRIRFWPTDALHGQQTVEETMQSHPAKQIWDRPLPPIPPPSSGSKSNSPITPLLLCSGSALLYVMGWGLQPVAVPTHSLMFWSPWRRREAPPCLNQINQSC